MHPVVRGGLLIGGSCVAWTFLMGLTGWYRDPVLLNLFWVVILLEVGFLVVGLRASAARNGYGAQVAAGTLMALLGAVLIFGGSLLFTTVAFPDYFEELERVGRSVLAEQGLPAAEIDRQMAEAAPMQKPLPQALAGAVGTIVTGLVASLVIAAFVRKRPA